MKGSNLSHGDVAKIADAFMRTAIKAETEADLRGCAYEEWMEFANLLIDSTGGQQFLCYYLGGDKQVVGARLTYADGVTHVFMDWFGGEPDECMLVQSSSRERADWLRLIGAKRFHVFYLGLGQRWLNHNTGRV